MSNGERMTTNMAPTARTLARRASEGSARCARPIEVAPPDVTPSDATGDADRARGSVATGSSGLDRQRPLLALRASVAMMVVLVGVGLAVGMARAEEASQPVPKAKAAAKPNAKSTTPAGPQQPASDLDNELLDGLPPAKKTPGKSAPEKKPADQAPTEPAPVTEGPTMGADPSNPFNQISAQMQTVGRQLAAKGHNTATEELQGKIVDELSQIIEQLEKQQSGSPPARDQPPKESSAAERKKVRQPGPPDSKKAGGDDRPAKESTEGLGKNEEGRSIGADGVRGLMKDAWGQLPAREREQMLQAPPEQFLPKYELLLEKYYKRLAEEQQRRR